MFLPIIHWSLLWSGDFKSVSVGVHQSTDIHQSSLGNSQCRAASHHGHRASLSATTSFSTHHCIHSSIFHFVTVVPNIWSHYCSSMYTGMKKSTDISSHLDSTGGMLVSLPPIIITIQNLLTVRGVVWTTDIRIKRCECKREGKCSEQSQQPMAWGQNWTLSF